MEEEQQKEAVKALARVIGENAKGVTQGKFFWLILMDSDESAHDWARAINKVFKLALKEGDSWKLCAAANKEGNNFIAVLPAILHTFARDEFFGILNDKIMNIKEEFLAGQDRREIPGRVEKILKGRQKGNPGALDKGWGPRD